MIATAERNSSLTLFSKLPKESADGLGDDRLDPSLRRHLAQYTNSVSLSFEDHD